MLFIVFPCRPTVYRLIFSFIYCDFSNFEDGRRRHLGFLKSRIFIGYWGPEDGDASVCQISSTRSIGCEDIKFFFSIFQDGGRPPSWICLGHISYLDHQQWVFLGLYHSAKFCYDRCSSFYNMNISIFGPFGWKMPIHTHKIGVFGQFDPLNGLQYQPKP